MKRLLIIFAAAILFCAAAFPQENSARNDGGGNSSEIEFSVLDKSLLIHSSRLLARITDFQTPGGEKIAYKKANEMLRSVAENERLMREYAFWHTADIVSRSVFWVSLDTGLVCLFMENLPYRSEILLTTLTAGSLAVLGGIFSGHFSTSKYFQAVDNYNLSIINSARK